MSRTIARGVACDHRFQLRLAHEDRERIRRMAQRAQRTETEFIRMLVRSIDPDRVTTGIPTPAPTALEASGPKVPAA